MGSLIQVYIRTRLRKLVSIWVQDGYEVYREIAQNVLVFVASLGVLLNEVGDDCRGDPLPRVDT